MNDIFDKYPNIVDGELTFIGVLNRYFYDVDEYECISSKWKAESTRNQYIRDYDKRLIPEIDHYKPMSKFTSAEFRTILSKIKAKYKYSDEVMMHYCNLIYKAYSAGVLRGLYEDKLQWNDYDFDISEKPVLSDFKAIHKHAVIRKSFSYHEEKSLLNWFKSLNPIDVSGIEVGFVLMLFMPTRNQEICGLNYGDIKELTEKKLPFVYITKTTKGSSTTLKMGGKTRNAIRVLPLHQFLYSFLIERKNFIENKINKGEIILPQDITTIDGLPIVSKNDYISRCNSGDLSNFAKRLFNDIGVGKEVLNNAGKSFFTSVGIEEEDPTAYLLRRNNCTQLACLGFDENEIQYLMGHEIESDVYSRSFYANEDELISLYNKYRNHPYNIYITEEQVADIKVKPREVFIDETSSNVKYSIGFDNPMLKRTLRLLLNEPSDTVKITTGQNTFCNITSRRTLYNSKYRPNVNVSSIISKKY